MPTLDDVLLEISKFSLVDKEILNGIITKRLIEEKRQIIYENYQRSLKNYYNCNVETGNVDDLFRDIEQ